MGTYLNPGSDSFRISLRGDIYIDKTGLIAELNHVINKENRFVCVSRPRRFGKSMAANMLTAYYGRGENTEKLFSDLKISNDESYKEHLNRYDVIKLDTQAFLTGTGNVAEMKNRITKYVKTELFAAYPDVPYMDKDDFAQVFADIYEVTKHPFIVLIDEWDCIFREYKNDTYSQKSYLDFLRNWLRDRTYIGLAYMTGILPIKKYGTHSALGVFTEYSMTNPRKLAPHFGFTEDEVKELCCKYEMSLEDARTWYDGYKLRISPKQPVLSIYNPKSVVEAMGSENFDAYWNQTETYEALQIYIQMNYDGLKDAIVEMLAGGSVRINTGKFKNDMTTFKSKDDVLTLLVHLGYLTYDVGPKTVGIPNKEVAQEYINSIEDSTGWTAVAKALENSHKLLQSLWNMDGKAVAKGIACAHQEVSVLQYNDENALSYTISLAFYYAREYYTIIRELPTGKGYADVCFIPRKSCLDKPALLVELKWDKTAVAALDQIKERNYPDALSEYNGNLILAGINYSKETKTHECVVEMITF